jgi:hypothetical protein
MQKYEVKFGEWIEQGFNLYKENLAVLILSGLVVTLLGGITMGILAGPLTVGMILICLALVDKKEPKPEVGDVFNGFQYFLNSFLFVLVWGLISFAVIMLLNLIPCLGQIASFIVSLAISALIMFGLFLIADKNMDFWPASKESIEMIKPCFWPMMGLVILASVIGSIGLVLCGIGIIVTMPITYCILAVAYRDITSGNVTVVDAADTADVVEAEVSEEVNEPAESTSPEDTEKSE